MHHAIGYTFVSNYEQITESCHGGRAHQRSTRGCGAGTGPDGEPLRPFIDSFNLDRIALLRYYNVDLSNGRSERLKRFYTDWRGRLATITFDSLPQDGKVDYVLFRSHLDHELARLGL